MCVARGDQEVIAEMRDRHMRIRNPEAFANFGAGNRVPDFFGVDVIAALAFRLTSPKAALFRNWMLRRMAEPAPVDPLERFCSATSVLS